MTDDELRSRFDHVDQRFDAIEADVAEVKAGVAEVKADVAVVKDGVSAILKHLDIDDELENTAHVQQRIARSAGPSTPLRRAAKGPGQ